MNSPTTTTRTIDQQRAEHALKQIQSIQGDKNDGMYVSYVSSLPATIVMNGLGHALVTQLAKAKPLERDQERKDSHRLLYAHLASWLAKQVEQLEATGNGSDVVQQLMKKDQDVYLRAQAEAMAYLNWLKQFARAYLTEKEGQGD